MEGNLSIGGVFGTAFSVFGARWRVLVPIVFLSSLAVSVATHFLGEDLAGVLVGFILDIALFALVQAAAMVVLRDLRERRPGSPIREVVATALPPFPAATLAASVAAAGVFVGLLLLIVPGLYLMTIWALLLPVMVVERPGVFDAFDRSRHLVSGNGWRVFGIILLGLLLIGVGLPIAILLGNQVEGALPRILVGSLVSAITTTLQALVLGALYYRLRDAERAGSVLEQPGDSPG